MSVYIPAAYKSKKKSEKIYFYDFQYRGFRFSGSTRTADKREAEAVESVRREEVRQEVKTVRTVSGLVSFRLDDVAEKFWYEKGQKDAGPHNIRRDLARLVEKLGPDKIVTQISNEDVAALVAWRRTNRAAPSPLPKGKKLEDYPFVSNGTVNRTTTELLRRVINHAKRKWKLQFDHDIEWGSKTPGSRNQGHLLNEVEERPRELADTERKSIDDNTRDDYALYFAFAKASGLRQKITLLEWTQVKMEAGYIRLIGKGGVPNDIDITPLIRQILEACMGHHPKYVFTYVAQRTLPARKAGQGYKRTGVRAGEDYEAQRDQEARVKGKRYPITLSGLKSAWKRLKKAAEVEDFRFHDLRHDMATKILRDTGNLKLVGQVLHHKSLKTTMRYAHVTEKDKRAALEDFQAKYVKLPASVQDGGNESHKKSHKRLKKIA